MQYFSIKTKLILIKISFLTGYIFFLTSCSTYKTTAYFKDVPDSTVITLNNAVRNQLRIEKNDILNIEIMTIDPSANAIFSQQINLSKVSQSNGPDNSQGLTSLSGSNGQSYTVDNAGEIELPLLGRFYAIGKSTDNLRQEIQSKASELFKTPSVQIHIANFRVNVLGEVNKPGTISFTNERNTILDAIAAAGDLTIYGKRENVILLRDSAGKTEIRRFSLNSKQFLQQPYFYLKQNDIIYVEPGKSKLAGMDSDRLKMYSIFTTTLSVTVTLVLLFKSL